MLNTRLQLLKKIYIYIFFKCEIKTASKCQQVTVKRVIAIEPNNLNTWFIQERNTVMLLRDTRLCMVAVFGIIFVVEIEQRQVILCLKRKSLN